MNGNQDGMPGTPNETIPENIQNTPETTSNSQIKIPLSDTYSPKKRPKTHTQKTTSTTIL